MLPPAVVDVARAVRGAGGRALVVGGYVRDRVLGQESKDVDVEVFGLSVEQLENVLARFGRVISVGRSFGVLRVKGLDVDFSLPRRDRKVGPGHRGFDITVDPTLSFQEGARRRDLTMNSMALDPLSDELLDPHGGQRDIAARILRATDAAHFSEDPLRGIRVAQLAARFGMRPDEELLELCAALDLSELPGERVFEEFRKLLVKGARPSLGLEVLREGRMLRFFPELEALVDVPQDPKWHPEGDVWVHTLMVVDEAAAMRRGAESDLALMFGALCHDFGKPATTYTAHDGRIRSPRHELEGLQLTSTFLERMRAPNLLVRRVRALVEHHLAPLWFAQGGASPRAYRRLARKLAEADVSIDLLYDVARADHLGRTTEEARARVFPDGERFLERIAELELERQVPRDVVLGRHLIARGLEPGPEFGALLARCREIQDETGWDDPERILDRAWSEGR